MPVRIGTDLVSVEAVSDSLKAHGERYLARIYTGRERADCGDAAPRLAARFAAKEAALKVLRPGDQAIPWRTIEVVRKPGGWVELELTGAAAEHAAAARISDFAVSLTHEGAYASAVVVGELLGGKA